MQIITGEFVILALLIYISNNIRKRNAVVESFLRGCVVFFPPEKNSDQKSITYVQIDDKFSAKSPFFADAELLVMVLYLIFGLLSLSFLLSLNPWISFGNSIGFYMVIMGILLSIYGLFRQSIQAGFGNPENILGLFYSLIIFFALNILLNSEHQEILDFNFPLATELMKLQVIKSLKPFMPASFKFEIDYFLIATILSFFISLAMYPSFRYISRFISGFSNSVSGYQKIIYSFLIISPVILCTLWIKPMTKAVLEPVFGSNFALFRTGIVQLICFLKLFNLRYEIQCLLNQSTQLVKDTLRHPNKENIESCTKKCRAIATNSWPVAHQSLCCASLIILIAFVLVMKGNITQEYPKSITESIIVESYSGLLDDDEFVIQGTEPIQLVKNITYIKEVKELQDSIKLIQAGEKNELMESVLAISRQQIINEIFYRDACEIALFSFFAGWSLASIMAFAILNVVPGKSKTS